MEKGGYAYVSPEVRLNLTSAEGGFTVVSATGRFIKTSNNIWRMKFNISYSVTSGAKTGMSFNIVGILSNLRQSVNCMSEVATTMYYAIFSVGVNSITIAHLSVATVNYYVTGDVVLASKPTAYLPDGV
jgi:hypothetical protein